MERLPFPTIVVASLNDPYLSLDLDYLVVSWGSELMTIGFAGHINVASGFGRWSEGYVIFGRLARSVAQLRYSSHTKAIRGGRLRDDSRWGITTTDPD